MLQRFFNYYKTEYEKKKRKNFSVVNNSVAKVYKNAGNMKKTFFFFFRYYGKLYC